MNYKFLWNGIKDTETGKLYKCEYFYRGSLGKGIEGIYIRVKNTNLPKISELKVTINRNPRTGWFSENIFLKPNNKYYKHVEEALRKRREHYMKIMNKKREENNYEY